MKRYIKAATSDISISEIQKQSYTNLCEYLGLKKYNNIWAGKYGDDIIIYYPEWLMDNWIRVNGFKHDFKQNTYEKLLDAFKPDADLADIAEQFNCDDMVAYPFASDIMTI